MATGDRVKQMQREAAAELERRKAEAEAAAVAPKDEEAFSKKVERAAETLFDWVLTLDAMWAQRMVSMCEERGLSKLQALGALVAYPLDHSLQMAIPTHPAFEGALWRPDSTVCPECGVKYEPRYPGEPFCSGRCAETYRGREREKSEAEAV